jgi:5'-methylthioinosine phosphorylase
VFLARHGHPHKLPPHKVNYRANLLALKEAGVTEIIAVNAVGGITEAMDAEAICIPDQVIDYTHGREDTFYDGVYLPLDHVDFSHPYDQDLSSKLYFAAESKNIITQHGGVYAATQGPRLETIAEIKRLENDGCDVVGMTGMPEAVLARELNIPYASLSLVVNKAAGKSDELITMDDIRRVLDQGMHKVQAIIAGFLASK